MVQLDGPTSMVCFLEKSIYKAFGPLTRCTKRNDHAPKSERADFLNTFPKMSILRKKNSLSLTILLSTSSLPRKSKNKKLSKFYYNKISLPWALAFFLLEHLFCFSFTSFANSVEPCQWIMQALKYVFWRSRTSWSIRPFVPWCKLKWSRAVFNNQSQVLQGLGTTPWSVV